jgi:hypothetical protein
MYVNAPPPPPPTPGESRGLGEEVTGMKGEQTSDNKQTIGRRGARDPGTKDRVRVHRKELCQHHHTRERKDNYIF